MVERKQANEAGAISSAACDSLLQALVAVTPILEAFNHRHSNQHAAAHWWAAFSILRRRTHKLCLTAKAASRFQGRKQQRYLALALGESKHLLHHTIPQAYIASTQLAADNQHAPLGLLLLTCIAQINAALTETLPEALRPVLLTPSEDKNIKVVSIKASEDDGTTDKGFAISRNDVESSNTLPRKALPAEAKLHIAARKTGDAGQDREKLKKKRKKKAKKGGADEFSSLFGSLM